MTCVCVCVCSLPFSPSGAKLQHSNRVVLSLLSADVSRLPGAASSPVTHKKRPSLQGPAAVVCHRDTPNAILCCARTTPGNTCTLTLGGTWSMGQRQSLCRSVYLTLCLQSSVKNIIQLGTFKSAHITTWWYLFISTKTKMN